MIRSSAPPDQIARRLGGQADLLAQRLHPGQHLRRAAGVQRAPRTVVALRHGIQQRRHIGGVENLAEHDALRVHRQTVRDQLRQRHLTLALGVRLSGQDLGDIAVTGLAQLKLTYPFDAEPALVGIGLVDRGPAKSGLTGEGWAHHAHIQLRRDRGDDQVGHLGADGALAAIVLEMQIPAALPTQTHDRVRAHAPGAPSAPQGGQPGPLPQIHHQLVGVGVPTVLAHFVALAGHSLPPVPHLLVAAKHRVHPHLAPVGIPGEDGGGAVHVELIPGRVGLPALHRVAPGTTSRS